MGGIVWFAWARVCDRTNVTMTNADAAIVLVKGRRAVADEASIQDLINYIIASGGRVMITLVYEGVETVLHINGGNGEHPDCPKICSGDIHLKCGCEKVGNDFPLADGECTTCHGTGLFTVQVRRMM